MDYTLFFMIDRIFRIIWIRKGIKIEFIPYQYQPVRLKHREVNYV